MVKIKICGVTNVADAVEAVELGADAVGLNFYSGSPRHITIAKATEIIRKLPPFVEPVAVFVNEPIQRIKYTMRELGLRTFQWHGGEKSVDNDNSYTLNDFRKQLPQMMRRGSTGVLIKMLPGDEIPNDEAMDRIKDMIEAMTDAERDDPDMIDAKARQRIATACESSPDDVKNFLKRFKRVRLLMRQMANAGDVSMWHKIKLISSIRFYSGKITPARAHPLRVIPAFGIRDKKSLRVTSAYLKTCIQKAHLPVAILVDAHVPGTYGGTGQTLPWELLADFNPGVPLILAGGLTADNVAQAIRMVRPYAVDVASGVESSPGKKDAAKMKRFIEQVRSAE